MANQSRYQGNICRRGSGVAGSDCIMFVVCLGAFQWSQKVKGRCKREETPEILEVVNTCGD